ncbi:hypothetical protein OHW86_10225 [Acinetobacter baumannii]|nr:hypothetical protein [Acinetobacter baumannii]
MTDLNKGREALVAQIEEFKKDAMELWFVPDLAESYKNMDMFSYSIVENNEVFFMREQARQLWSFWNKAKAQAVPEGFKLVPVELYNFQANRLAEEEFKQNEKLFNMEHRGLSGTEVELRKLKWLQCKAESIKQNYRQLVKWASESGAEG